MVLFSSFSCMKTNLGFIPPKKMSTPLIKHTTSNSKPSILNLYPPKTAKSFQDASISSYLHGAPEETFVLKRLNSPIPTFSTTPYDNIFLGGRNNIDDKELEVFNAEKYFNEGLPKIPTKKLSDYHLKKDETLEVFSVKGHTMVFTPSTRSETSSNSRSTLIKNQQPRRINYKKSSLASIGWNCSCHDKNSLGVDDSTDDGKSKQGDKIRDGFVKRPDLDYNSVKSDEPETRVRSSDHFSFPGFDSRPGNGNHTVSSPGYRNQTISRPGNGSQAENNLTMFTWDELRNPSISMETDHDDSASDASSDLFEIESFSTRNHFLSRQTSDGLSGCYAPSEASIEWSVITTRAADNSSSVPSDSDELKSTITYSQKVGLNSNNGTLVSKTPKRRSSIRSGCKSQKAVTVAVDAYRSNYKRFSNGKVNSRQIRLDR